MLFPIVRSIRLQYLGLGFSQGDTDGDGALSQAEAQALIPDLDEASFDALDANDDGLLQESELVSASDDTSDASGCVGSKKQGDWRKQLGDWMGMLIGLAAVLVARRSHAWPRRKK